MTTDRKITSEATKAETALVRLDKAAAKSIALCQYNWAEKRKALVESFPARVRKILVAGGVLEDE